MAKTATLDYFYGKETEQYNFYRIPKILFTYEQFKDISFEAKMLYGLMLDRMGLSVANRWIDDSGRVYIYFTLENAMELLGCGHDKAIRLFNELDIQKGIGLIERKKQGQGRPAMIYIKNFASLPVGEESLEPVSNITEQEEILTSEIKKSAHQEQVEAFIAEKKEDFTEGKIESVASNKPKSVIRKIRTLKFGKADTNNTDINNTEYIDINQSIYQDKLIHRADKNKKDREKQIDMIDIADSYRKLVMQNIEYDILINRYPYDEERLEEILELIIETVCCSSEIIDIGKKAYHAEVVKSRMLKLILYHIDYVIDSLDTNTNKIYNIRNYLLTTLISAPVTISSYYEAKINNDFNDGNYS